jgi:cell division protein FtsA
MPKNSVAVLDIGSEKLSVIIGERDVNNTFKILGIGESDYAGFMEGEFIRPEELKLAIGLAITNAETNSKTSIEDLYIGVPAEFAFCVCKNVEQNYPKPRAIKQQDVDELFEKANKFEYNSHAVVNQSSIYFMLDDGAKINSPLGQTSSKLNACLSFILVERGFIKLIDSFAEDLGLHKIIYISSTLAQSQYLFDEEERDRYVILVDCGYITTSVSLVRGNGLLNMNSFSMGGGHITADLSECLKISFTQAEALKRKIVLSIEPGKHDVYENIVDGNVVPINARNANEIVKARIEEIAKFILKALNSCKFEYPDYIPIHLTGGGLCYLKGAKDYLAKCIGKNIEIIHANVPQYNKPHLTSTLGMLDAALRQEQISGKRKGLWGRFLDWLR